MAFSDQRPSENHPVATVHFVACFGSSSSRIPDLFFLCLYIGTFAFFLLFKKHTVGITVQTAVTAGHDISVEATSIHQTPIANNNERKHVNHVSLPFELKKTLNLALNVTVTDLGWKEILLNHV